MRTRPARRVRRRPSRSELRLNGTYVVFRKLYQDVAAFRRYLATAAKSLYGSDDTHHQELVAAKMMGRWRSGCPIDLSPDKDDPAIAADPQRRNDFTYAGDEQGLQMSARLALAPEQPASDAAQTRHSGATAPVAQAWRRVRPASRGGCAGGRRRRSRPDQPVHPGRHRAAVRVRPEGMDEGRGVHRARSERAGPDSTAPAAKARRCRCPAPSDRSCSIFRPSSESRVASICSLPG